MIVPKRDIWEIMRGELGEAVVDDPPAVGSVCWVRESPRVEPACQARVVDVWPIQQGGHAVLLERVYETFALPERRPPERPSLRLTRGQRAKLFAGECPHIGGRGKAPVKAGEKVRLSSRVTLTVVRVDVKNGRWKLMYELHDARDTIRLLRRTPPAHREGGEADHPTRSALRDAAEQSAYTSSPAAAVSDAGEAPPKVWLDVRAKTVGEFDHQQRLARHAERLRERSKDRRKRAA